MFRYVSYCMFIPKLVLLHRDFIASFDEIIIIIIMIIYEFGITYQHIKHAVIIRVLFVRDNKNSVPLS